MLLLNTKYLLFPRQYEMHYRIQILRDDHDMVYQVKLVLKQ